MNLFGLPFQNALGNIPESNPGMLVTRPCSGFFITGGTVLKFITIILLCLTPKAFSQFIPEKSCEESALTVTHSLYQVWQYADREPRSNARDAVWSAKEFARPYYEIMKVIPGKFDRTKGVYLELEDKIRFMKRLSDGQDWQDFRVAQGVDRVWQDLCSLARCYGRFP